MDSSKELNKEWKDRLLKYVEEIGKEKEYWQGKNAILHGSRKPRKPIGSSNIRDLGNLCQQADCYNEIKLFIEYKISKGNGWNVEFKNNKSFGEVFIEYMNDIYIDNKKDDKKTLNIISKFCGYLYWKTRAMNK